MLIVDNRSKEILNIMLKARNAKYSVPLRYGKVLFCGAAAAGKSNFLNLLMEQDFQPLHISTEVLKPQQVTVAMKAVVSTDDDKVEFKRMNIDDEILQLESYLPENFSKFASSPSSSAVKNNSQISQLKSKNADHKGENADHKGKNIDISVEESKLTFTNMNEVKKLAKKPGDIWDILTFMDTGGQPQFISMLPAVNSFAMITFIIHKVVPGGQDSLNNIVEVQYGNEKGKVSFKPHPHKFTYHQLIETLISYASNVLLPDTTFLDKLKIKSAETENIRSILLVGTHCGDNKLSENDIIEVDNKLTKHVEKLGVNHIKPFLNKDYQTLVPVDNKVQGKNSKPQVITENAKRYTKPSEIRNYIQKFLNNQDVIHVPIKWLLLELEIRKICQEKKCNLMSYSDVLKLAKEKKLDYSGEFGDDAGIDADQFIKQGLRFHHSFGVLLYFEDVIGMQKLVITNHQWLFNKLSKIVEFSFTCDTQEEFKDLQNGIFKKSFLGNAHLDIVKDFEASQIDTERIDPIRTFLNLLEYLQIAAPLNQKADKYFMPCLLDSNDLTDIKEKVPACKASNNVALLIQFKSVDNKTYAFPRGVFCFLIVELMVSMKWEPFEQAYVNLLTLCKMDTGHYITLIDRIFCLEVHVTYRKSNNIHDEIRDIISNALRRVSRKLKIPDILCYGFTCMCERIKEVHITYVREDNDEYCLCAEKSLTTLTDAHKIWLKEYFKVRMYVCLYLYYYLSNHIIQVIIRMLLSTFSVLNTIPVCMIKKIQNSKGK